MVTITFHHKRYKFQNLKEFRTGELKLLHPKIYFLYVNRFCICNKIDMMSKGEMETIKDMDKRYRFQNVKKIWDWGIEFVTPQKSMCYV